VNVHHGDEAGKTKNGEMAPYLARQMLKWFYDTSPVPLLEQYRCGSFVGGAQIARGVGYQGTRWTRGFTWFGPPERNTLRPRENEVVLLSLVLD
jgi:hypothetical protein